jgi:hypothetical protein
LTKSGDYAQNPLPRVCLTIATPPRQRGLQGQVLAITANPLSPRAGLLTFSEQGCDRFEKSEEPTDDETWRNRAEFKDRVEDILIEAHGQYVHLEIGKLNDPNAHDFIWFDHYESSIQRALDLLLCRLLKGEATFDRRQATEEMIAELKQESESIWECGRVTQLRILKRRLGDQAAESLTIRMPDIRSRDDEFWGRVEAANRRSAGAQRPMSKRRPHRRAMKK